MSQANDQRTDFYNEPNQNRYRQLLTINVRTSSYNEYNRYRQLFNDQRTDFYNDQTGINVWTSSMSKNRYRQLLTINVRTSSMSNQYSSRYRQLLTINVRTSSMIKPGSTYGLLQLTNQYGLLQTTINDQRKDFYNEPNQYSRYKQLLTINMRTSSMSQTRINVWTSLMSRTDTDAINDQRTDFNRPSQDQRGLLQ
ncbi:unnamed protein product [Mytilus edulis]|uniref:Uncharacterized protein n=1 Tax=Mytilus edulis TaxID=6550 RepID=A0A8S3RWA7_MYTED|nr:unnamed protein product [Mytilus edulis]